MPIHAGVRMGLKPGLRVLVTAGAGGIGRAIADMLIGQGARLHVCDVAEDALEAFRTAHPRHGASRADVASETDVEAMFADVRRSLGGLDALVNNAGIAGPTGGVEEISPADWRRCIDVCLTGQFLCAHHAVPMIKAAGGGAIVNLSSAAGRHGYAFRTPYSAAKFGVIGLTQSLAKELGPAQYPRQRHSARHRRRAAHGKGHSRPRRAARHRPRRDGAALSRAGIAEADGLAARCCRRRSRSCSPRWAKTSPASRSGSTGTSRPYSPPARLTATNP